MAKARDPNERTRDVYEHITAYTKPPAPPLIKEEDLDEVLAEQGQPEGSLARRITDIAFSLTGVRPFLRRLPTEIEHLLRTNNMRLPGLYSTVISATLALADDERITDPYLRAATLIRGTCSFMKDVFAGTLPPDMFRGEQLEMGQYPSFFATSLVVERCKVRIYKSTMTSRVNVIAGGRLYILEIGEHGDELSTESLAAALTQIDHHAQTNSEQTGYVSPGALTCGTPRTQHRAFRQLGRDTLNRQSLDELKHTLFTVCLDTSEIPATLAEASIHAQSRHPENRWYHSSLQLVIFGNAKAAAVCSFTAYLDGNVMMRGGSEIQRRAASVPLEESGPSPVLAFHSLDWRVPTPLLRQVEVDLERVSDHQVATFQIPGYGGAFFARIGVEPIPAFIAALQATANQLTGQHVNIVQFFTMSRYRCTDLVTGSISEPEVQRCADYLSKAGPAPAEARNLLMAAIHAQARAARSHRKHLSLPILLNLLVRTRREPGRSLTALAFRLRATILRRMGATTIDERDVLVSHPEIHPGVPIVGRPGVRLPYVKYFGLHYQIFPDQVTVTMMPGTRWDVPNEKVVETLCEYLSKIGRILEETAPA